MRSGPGLHGRELGEEENPPALCRTRRFHHPDTAGLLELFHEQGVVLRKSGAKDGAWSLTSGLATSLRLAGERGEGFPSKQPAAATVTGPEKHGCESNALAAS